MKVLIKTPKEFDWTLLYSGREELGLWMIGKIKERFQFEEMKVVGSEYYIWIKDDVTVKDVRREVSVFGGLSTGYVSNVYREV